MFAFSDGVGMKTAHNASSDAQKETTLDNVLVYDMKKRPRLEGTSYEKAVEDAKYLIMKNYTKKNAIMKERNEEIETLKNANGNQKEEINSLSKMIKTVKHSLQYEINQRESINNKIETTRKITTALEQYYDMIRNVHGKGVDDCAKIKVCYTQSVNVANEAQNDVQKYRLELNNVQKQLESEKQLRLELSNMWDDKNDKASEFIDSLKNQNSSLEEEIRNLKVKQDESAIREKQYQEEISNLTMFGKQTEHAILNMKSDFKSIYEKISQENEDLSKSLAENKTRISQLEDELEEVKLNFMKQDANAKVFQEKISDLSEEIEKLKKEVEEKSFFEQEVANLQMLKDSLENQNSTLENDKIKLDEQISRFKQELEENKIFIQEKCDEKHFLQKKVKDLEEELEKLKNEKENDITSLGIEFDMKLKVMTSSHDGEIKKYEKNILNLQEDLEAKSRKIIELNSEAELTLTKLKECELNLENTTTKLKLSNEEARILNEYTKDNNTEIEELKEKLADYENMYASVVNELKVLKEKSADNPTKNLNPDTDIVTRLDTFDTLRESVFTTRNSLMPAENKINEGVKSPIAQANFLTNYSYSNDNNSSYAQPKVLQKDKKKVSAMQKGMVTSTNGASSKKRTRFSKINSMRLNF